MLIQDFTGYIRKGLSHVYSIEDDNRLLIVYLIYAFNVQVN